MYSKILYPTDFSKNAEKALGYVKQLKSAGTVEVVITHIVEKRKILEYEQVRQQMEASTEGTIDLEDAEKLLLEQVYPKLQKIEKELVSLGIKASILVEQGVASQQICTAAKQVAADLIVLGYTGESLLKGYFMGSTVRHVVELSPVSVLVVK